MSGGVEASGQGSHGGGFVRADLPAGHRQAAGGGGVAQAGEEFGELARAVQGLWGRVAAEWGAGEAELPSLPVTFPSGEEVEVELAHLGLSGVDHNTWELRCDPLIRRHFPLLRNCKPPLNVRNPG